MRTQPVAVRKQLASAVCILGSAAAFMPEYGDGTKDPADLGTHLDVVGVALSFCTTQIFVWTGQPSVQDPAQASTVRSAS